MLSGLRPALVALSTTWLPACSGAELLGRVDEGSEAPFGEPMLISELSSPGAEDEGPTLTEDELEIFFESNRNGSRDIWTASRASRDAAWSSPQLVETIASADEEQDPSIAWDGLSLWFVRQPADALARLWLATRASRDAPWNAPIGVTELDADAHIRAPAVSGNGLWLTYCLFEGPVGGADMMLAQRSGRHDAWGTPTPIRELDTPYNDWDPYLSYDALHLFWASTDRQIVTALRPTEIEPFGPLSPVEGTGPAAFDPTLSRDLTRLYFASDRAGTADIYVTER